MKPTAAVVVFPASNCDHDAIHALGLLGFAVREVWHREPEIPRVDLVVLPGGFSFGDYLRCGAIARFSPVMAAVAAHAAAGRPTLGICNGFQVLCEAGLLPGALLPNAGLKFACKVAHLRAEERTSAFTRLIPQGKVLAVPIAHHDGRYTADDATLDRLEDRGLVAFRYCAPDGGVTPEANPNGSLRGIAGVLSESRNVLGLMPHPERAVEAALGSTDGRLLFESLLDAAGVAA